MNLDIENKTTNMPLVEIIIVTYNRESDVLSQLKQLLLLDYPKASYSITIINNNSSDNTASAIHNFIESGTNSHPNIRLLNLPTNQGGSGGFSTGINEAISKNTANYLWLLDDDATPRSDTLSYLVDAAEVKKGKCIIGGVILDQSDTNIVTEAGAKVRWWGARQELLHSGKNTSQLPSAPFLSEYASAACMLIPISAAKKLGGFENFFLHFDDVEWCLRAHKAGYPIFIEPKARVAHPVKRGEYRHGIKYYDVRNFLYVSAKHYKLATLYLFFRFLTKAIISSLTPSTRKESLEILKALLDFTTKTQGRMQ
ncbi:glycosyltransferase family 2 protein [Microbulbifer sp. JMSA003]|uniref:glycosyltransferase family 2 protein n=1 Tax=Microbulbifer sp. JMSA003 TaxID=3243369 RepID=UPI004039DAD4